MKKQYFLAFDLILQFLFFAWIFFISFVLVNPSPENSLPGLFETISLIPIVGYYIVITIIRLFQKFSIVTKITMVSIIPVSFFLYMGFLGGLYNGWLTYSTVLTRSVLNIILLLILSTPVFYFMRLTIKDLTHKEFFKKDVYKL